MPKPRLVVPLMIAVSLLLLAACGEEEEAVMQWSEPPKMTIDVAKTYLFTIETSEGAMKGRLFPGEAPVTVNNFVFLARQGYYDDMIVHRVLKGFMIQTGDPTGTGSGGPGYKFQDEPITREYLKGTLSMANAGPNTNGSQFFVVLGDLRGRLAKNHTVFGEVEEGLDVLDRIAETEVVAPTQGAEKSRPVKDIIVKKITIEEK